MWRLADVGVGHPLWQGVAEIAPSIDYLLGRAAADAQLQASAGDDVGRASVLCHVQRVFIPHIDDRRANLNSRLAYWLNHDPSGLTERAYGLDGRHTRQLDRKSVV